MMNVITNQDKVVKKSIGVKNKIPNFVQKHCKCRFASVAFNYHFE